MVLVDMVTILIHVKRLERLINTWLYKTTVMFVNHGALVVIVLKKQQNMEQNQSLHVTTNSGVLGPMPCGRYDNRQIIGLVFH